MRRLPLFIAATGLAAVLGATAVIAAPDAAPALSAKDQAKLDKALAGKTAGASQTCIPLVQIRNTTYVGNRTILYRISSNLVYRNDPPGGCPGLREGAGLITTTTTGMLCSGDIAQVRDFVAGFSTGACALGDFVPYRTAK